MATNQLIEDNANSTPRYYYVDQYGAMVKNTWKAVAMDDGNDNLDAEYYWYYFGNDGKAYTSKAPLSSSKIKTINGQKYAFDENGHMLYGWINKDNMEQQDEDEDAWSSSQYYFNGWNDGHMQTGWIQLTVKDTNVKDDQDETQTYWFHFKNSGEKRTKSAKINGTRYYFAEDGHMMTDWAAAAGTATAYSIKDGKDSHGLTTSSFVYVNGDGSQRKNKWVWTIPDEDFIQEDYENDDYRWFYFDNGGHLTRNKVKKINGKSYAFNNDGVMQVGFVDVGTYESVGKSDKYDRDGFIAGVNLDRKTKFTSTDTLRYFSDNEEKDGSMKKGYQNIALDDSTYQFYFNTSNGDAETKYNSKIKKYTIHGLVLAPTADDPSNYMGVSLNGDKPVGYSFGEATEGDVLVNRSGSVVKSKSKLKDSEDAYYIVNKKGVVLKYFDSEETYNSFINYTVDGKEKKASISSDALAKDTYSEFVAQVAADNSGWSAPEDN